MNFSALLDIYERRNIATGVPHSFCFHLTFDAFIVHVLQKLKAAWQIGAVPVIKIILVMDFAPN